MVHIRPDQYLVASAFACCLLIAPLQDTQARSTDQTSLLNPVLLEQTLLTSPTLYLPTRTHSIPSPIITADAAVVIDANHGTQLYALNPEVSLPPASITKIMTAIVARELYSLNEIITITNEGLTPGNTIGFASGERLSIQDLLASLLIFSGNDAAMALANHHPKGYDGFVQAMNDKAALLGLRQTSFANPTGLDDPNQFASAYDLARLMMIALQDQTLTEILRQQKLTVSSVDGQQHTLYSTNQLLFEPVGVIAGKTGSTPNAGECLITYTIRNDQPIITVVLGSSQRFIDTKSLLSWTYATYTWQPTKFTPTRDQ